MTETKRAFITGITGQDGSYLAELLLDKGYEVHGLVRRASTFGTERIDHLYLDPHLEDARMFLHYGDLSDSHSLTRLMLEVRPHEVYNLGAQSHVAVSFENPIYLGNLDAQRDWGFAGDYVEAMWLMLQQDTPDDYVVATGEMYSVREFAEKTFALLDLDWERYTGIDERYMRPAEVEQLLGDPTKANTQLDWKPKVSFDELVAMMVEADMKLASREKALIDAGLATTEWEAGRPGD